MAKAKKQPRPKAITPKGFRDYFGEEVTQRTHMLATIAEVYHHYGFEALESSAVETVEALGKFLPDVDRPNAGVFAWQEADENDPEGKPGDWMALRYDLTAPLARVYAQHRNDLPNPYRRFAMGPVWRNEKPGPGRYRQFYQCDADTVGTASMAADAEICMMLSDTLEKVGIPRGDYLVRVNNRKVLNGVLEAMGLAEEDPKRDDVLRTIDKFDKVGESGVRELLGKGRLDASGAYIDGVGLEDQQADPVLAFLTSKGDTVAETMTNLRAAVGDSKVGQEGVAELELMGALFAAAGYGDDRILIDPSIVLLAALREKGRLAATPTGPVVVTVMDRDRMADYQAMVAELRQAGIRAEVYLGNPKNFGNQLKYADKRHSPVAVIEGGDEKERGVIQIKDLILGAKIAESATLEEWKERPSQFEVPRTELVAKVRDILASQAKDQEG